MDFQLYKERVVVNIKFRIAIRDDHDASIWCCKGELIIPPFTVLFLLRVAWVLYVSIVSRIFLFFFFFSFFLTTFYIELYMISDPSRTMEETADFIRRRCVDLRNLSSVK